MLKRNNNNQPEGAFPVAKVLPFSRRKAILALDLEENVLHAVQASGTGPTARINRLATVKLELDPAKREDPAALGTAIKAALSNVKMSGREVALCLPRTQVVLRPLQVPLAADIRELASIINFQIAKDLPFRLE